MEDTTHAIMGLFRWLVMYFKPAAFVAEGQ